MIALIRNARRGVLAAGLCASLALSAAAPALARGTPEGFADLAERLSPAVVNISTTQIISRGEGQEVPMPQFPPGTPFEDLFRDFFERQQRGQDRSPRRAQSLGSGFVIDAAGYIVTNNHVIADADEIKVRFTDGRELPAELVGRDQAADLAVLKVKPDRQLTAVSFGDSDKARVGDWVLAIGNPFGLGGSISAGIVSARNRDINAGRYDDFIQTDAAINRGNSGGPLFNMDGQVVGINTAIISPSGGSIGIGFAVPSNMAKNVVEQLRTTGEVKRGWIGVRIQQVTDETAEATGLDKAKGALVADITAGGPADKGGLKSGDIIMKFNGKDVADSRALPRIVADTPIGKSVPVEVYRDGKTKALALEVGKLEETETAQAGGGREPKEQSPKNAGAPAEFKSLGLKLTTLTPQIRSRFGIDQDAKGLVVMDVDGKGPAAEKGLRPGDVIVEVAQQPVTSIAEMTQRMKDVEKGDRKSVLLLVDRGGEPLFVALRLSKG